MAEINTTEIKIDRTAVIQALKKRFPGNNPASWSRNSKTQLGEWYAEYILEDRNKKVIIN